MATSQPAFVQQCPRAVRAKYLRGNGRKLQWQICGDCDAATRGAVPVCNVLSAAPLSRLQFGT